MTEKHPKAAAKTDVEALPPLDTLPEHATDHPILHRIVHGRVAGTSKKMLATKLKLPQVYVNGVLHHYLERWDS